MSGLIKSTRSDALTPPGPPEKRREGCPADEERISALVTLLECETKPSNLAIIRAGLEELGSAALPWLDAAGSESGGGSRAAAEMALHIRRRMLDQAWGRWVDDGVWDLETGALLIDRFGNPLRDPDAVSRTLDELARETRLRLPAGLDQGQTIARLNAFLFAESGFHGNTESYEEPENSYLSCVLERRQGIPVSLSVVVLLLARRLDLPIVGIGMPGHFLLRYGSDPAGPYLDPFGGGRILSRNDCAGWLRASGFPFDPRMLRPVGPRYIVARMLRNLIGVFSKQGSTPEVELLTGYLTRVVAIRQIPTPVDTESRPRRAPGSG